MTRVLSFSERQIKRLQDVQDASIEDISRVQAALDAGGRRIIRVSALNKIAERALPEKPEVASLLIEMAILLSTVARRTSMSQRDLQSALEMTASKHCGTDPLSPQRWGLIAQISFAEVVYLSAKALDLSFDFERLFTTAKVITDLRPVFDEDASEPMGAIIVHSLQLEYLQNDRFLSLSLAVDKKDIRTLIEALQKALKKQENAKRLLPQLTADEIFVAGDERNDADG